MKNCFKCGLDKSSTDFYSHPETSDGLLGKCKACTKIDVYENRLLNREYYLLADKARSGTEARKAAHMKSQLKLRKKHPERRKAGSAVSNALQSGKLEKQPCLCCGSTEVEGHHPDYSRPLDVVWLCRNHHRQVHKEHKIYSSIPF